MKRTLEKLSRGSILAYSLILLGIVFVASIGMMSASVTNLRSVSSNDKSINAFQIADSGSQAVIKMLKSAGGNDLGDVSGVSCSGGDAFVESPGNFLGGNYKVTFQNSDGETMKCNGAKGKIADVTSVKSVGTYADTARAVQVAVAAGSGGVTGGCVVSGSLGNISEKWGSGCKDNGQTAGSLRCGPAAASGYECGPMSYDSMVSGTYFCSCAQ